MSQSRLAVMAVIGLAALTAWGLSGCGGSSGSGTGQLQVSLVDLPLNADEINVEITSVQVHSSGGPWVEVKSYDPALQVNLLDYSSSGTSLLLADAPLAAGHYTMVRLMLSSAEIVIGQDSYPVDLTNVAQTGVKANGQFTVEAGQLVALILDFNAAKSFVNNPPGSNNFMLHPVMTMSPVNIASEVTGTVEVQDSSGTVVPIPEGSVVNVYTEGYVGNPNYLVSGAPIEADGTFRIAVLQQGVYDFEIVLGDGTTKQVLGVTVTPPSTDLGTIIVQLP